MKLGENAIIVERECSEVNMAMTKKGSKVKNAMTKKYGKKKGAQIFYATKNKRNISGMCK